MLTSWKFWLGLGLLLGLITLVEYSYGWGAVLNSWRQIPVPSLALALGLMLTSYLLRALRFYDFFYAHCHGRFGQLTRITVLHNFFNNLLPMRSGEASFPLLMKQHFDMPFRQSTPALLWLRLLDLYALLALAGLSLYGYLPLPQWLIISIAVFILVAPLMILPLQNGLLNWLSHQSSGWANTLTEMIRALPQSPWPLARALLWTALNWSLKLAVYAWLLQQFLDVSFAQSWVGVSAGELSSVLPINGLAGAGTYEAGILAGLLPWGVDHSAALAAAVNVHLFVLGSTFFLTGLLLLVARVLNTSTSDTPSRNLR